MFRELMHPASRTRSASRPAARALVYSGDTAVTPALGEHAAGADLLLTEATALPCSAVHLPAGEAGASPARPAARGSCSRTWTCGSAPAALRQAREAFGGPVSAAVPGLRVAV